MLTILRASIASVALLLTTGAVSAASLQVSPVMVEIPAGQNAKTMNLKNTGKDPFKAQVRVFKWSIVNGQDKLEPATDVVASPPMITIKPETDYTVRLVRLSKTPVASEESYRILIDEIADPAKRAPGTVVMQFRYSIPVFFMPPAAAKGTLNWTQEVRNGKTIISATNTGGRRVRLADVAVADGKKKPTLIAKGLAGYVLARSSMSWVAPQSNLNTAQPLQITALSEFGPINAQALPQPAR